MNYVGIRETARQVGVHENTVRNWCKAGLIEFIVLPGSGYRRIPESEVTRMKMLDAGRQEPCPARFIKEALRDPEQDVRQNCAKRLEHRGFHTNYSGDLHWQDGAEISLVEILNGQMEHVKVVL